jgi:hypothetical protein
MKGKRIMSERLDLTGQIIGKWKVGKRIVGKNKKSYFECECLNCGTIRLVKGSALTSGSSKSCGCMIKSQDAICKRKQTLKEKNIMVDHTSVSLLKKICKGELMSNNTSGCTGVSKKGNRWTAEIRYKGVYHYLGLWDTYEEAVAARRKGEELYFGEILTRIY